VSVNHSRQTLLAKLVRLTLGAVFLAVALTFFIVVSYEVTTFRPRAIELTRAQARLLAGIIVPALEFDDATTAGKLLEVVRHEQLVEAVAVYHANGQAMAEFRRPGISLPPPPTTEGFPAEGGVTIEASLIQVVVPVRPEGGDFLGWVWLRASLPGWAYRIKQYGPVLVLVALVVTVLSLVIALATRRQITDPIQSLMEAVRRIGVSQNLELRVPETEHGEVGTLAHSFNEMLTAIGQRDRLLQAREARLVRHNTGLAQLSRTELRQESDYTSALRRITELAADIQDVGRVSIWFLDEPREALQCADLFERVSRRHSLPGALGRADFPHYFQTLDEGEILEIPDAHTDSRTREMTSNYLDVHGVGAMLDVPIHWRGRVMGVLCHEHVGGVRPWHADETALATAFAERIAHLMEQRSTMHADAALRDSEARYREFINQAQDAIFALTLEGRIESVNQAARRITGWELNTWIGHRFQRVLLPEDVALAEGRFAEVVAGGSPPSFELRIRSRHGGLVTLEFVVSPQLKEGRVVGLLGIGRDVTERKQAAETRSRLEEQLRHSQKMEAIGTMAGGIAHDFNNLLTAIIGNAQLAELDLRKADPVREYLMQVLIASHRAKELVQQILAFSRRQEQVLAPVSLDQVVSESLKLLRPVIASTIRIETKLPPGLPPVSGDATQLQQVVVNLATNAAHAMEDKGGLLELVLEEVEVNLEMCRMQPELKPGHYVRLSVTDNGIGMSAAVLEKIFDPFFTTKDKGKGTGLGLAVVHGIVQQHGGMISVSSVLGEGTTFRVYCPSASGTPPPAVPSAALNFAGAGEPVLVIDDEEQILRVAVSVLQRSGYHPVAYHDPLRALAAFSERPDHWRLVVTDQLMPSIKGTALAAEIWKLRPGFPVVLATGFSGNLDENVIRGVGFAGILAKPYTKESLLAQVGHALQRRV
jgi:PAS domain S-box-containing protein